MSSPTHRSKLSMGAIIVIGLLLVVGAFFLVAVHRQVQANESTFIELDYSPEVVEFEGFIDYGSPIQTTGTDASGNPVTLVLTESRIDRPVFTNVTLVSRMKFRWREWNLAAKQVLENLHSGQRSQESQAAPTP